MPDVLIGDPSSLGQSGSISGAPIGNGHGFTGGASTTSASIDSPGRSATKPRILICARQQGHSIIMTAFTHRKTEVNYAFLLRLAFEGRNE